MWWWSNVMLIDTETGNQIGECWIVEAQAETKAEAAKAIRLEAWKAVDTRLNDVRIDVLDGPTAFDAETCEECGAAIPTGPTHGGLANYFHDRSCSLYDPEGA